MRTDTYCPWEMADRLGVTVTPTRLNRARGYTDGCGRIWYDDRLTEAESRCTITHELFHVIHGHVGRQPDHIEEKIRGCTARWLIPWHHLLDAFGEQLSAHDIAETLGVTVDVLHDRLEYATPNELTRLHQRTSCTTSAA